MNVWLIEIGIILNLALANVRQSYKIAAIKSATLFVEAALNRVINSNRRDAKECDDQRAYWRPEY